MQKKFFVKIRKTAPVLLCLLLVLTAGRLLWAEAKLDMSKAGVKGGNCAACHGQDKVLSKGHIDTKAMNWEACKACHTKDNLSLTGKLPNSHHHLLAGIGCIECHGKTQTPGELEMDKCVACHGSTEKLAEKTKDVKPTNPHTSPHYGTELDCNLCHHQHTRSENYCSQCHSFDFKTP